MSITKTQTGRPSGFQRETFTLGAMMLLVAIVAAEFWAFREALSRRSPLALLAFVAGFILVGMPAFVRAMHWHSIDPCFQPIDPGSEQVPLQVAEGLAKTAPKLDALGFRPLGHYRIERAVPNAVVYTSLFDHPKARRTAQLLTVFGVNRAVTALGFTAAFSDGTELHTDNTRIADVLAPGLYREGSMSFPQASDPGHLYEVHEACVARFAPDAILIPPETRAPAAYLRASCGREVACFAEAGYYRPDEGRRGYRLTWKGTYIVTGKLIWTIKSVRQMLARRRAARVLRELGLEHILGRDSAHDHRWLPLRR